MTAKEAALVYPRTPGSRLGPVVPPHPARHRPNAEMLLVGAHGGAGVTTLAVLLSPAWDLGMVQRAGPGRASLRPAGRPVVLVARNTAPAADRAVAATGLLSEQRIPVAVLAVISDGLPEPAEARYRFRVLEGRVGAVVRVPFVPALRVAADPLAVHLPHRARRALARIRALAREQMPYP